MTGELVDVDRLASLVDVDRAAQWAPGASASLEPSEGTRVARGVWQGMIDAARDTWSRGRDDVVTPNQPTARQEPRPVPPALVRFVCGNHLDQHVVDRGRRCPKCTTERGQWLRARRQRRAARRAGLDPNGPTYLV